eukprot:4222269-Lingulodinium_polyedra.AAC.1
MSAFLSLAKGRRVGQGVATSLLGWRALRTRRKNIAGGPLPSALCAGAWRVRAPVVFQFKNKRTVDLSEYAASIADSTVEPAGACRQSGLSKLPAKLDFHTVPAVAGLFSSTGPFFPLPFVA